MEKIAEHLIFQNMSEVFPRRHAKFPGIVQLPSGELYVTYEIRDDETALNSHVGRSISNDNGQTWSDAGDLYDLQKRNLPFPVSESLKPTLLRNGSLAAMGYRFYRENPECPIGNGKTGGLLPGENIITFSHDNGRSWFVPRKIEHPFPEILELSGPCLELACGDFLAAGPPFKMWDGGNPSGQNGILLRSLDRGASWDAVVQYFTTQEPDITPWETRLCEMQPGRIVAIVWAYDMANNKHLPNHIVFSQDNGYTWSAPAATPHMAQASNLMWLEDNYLLSVHCHRADVKVGLFARVIDFSKNRWKVIDEKLIWSAAQAQNVSKDIISQFNALQFGQPTPLKLKNGDIFVVHWCADENSPGKILGHTLKINL
jgi:sialidase-1